MMACLLQGSHKLRQYGPSDWFEVAAIVMGIPLPRLFASMDAACVGTRMKILDTGKSYDREVEIEPMFSKSSSKVELPMALAYMHKQAG